MVKREAAWSVCIQVHKEQDYSPIHDDYVAEADKDLHPLWEATKISWASVNTFNLENKNKILSPSNH